MGSCRTPRNGFARSSLQKPRAEWVEVFQELDACVEPVLSISETAEHPQTLARTMVVNVPKFKR